jgi:hypothetical protein
MGRGWSRGLPLIFRFSRPTAWQAVENPVSPALRRGTLILVNSPICIGESMRFLSLVLESCAPLLLQLVLEGHYTVNLRLKTQHPRTIGQSHIDDFLPTGEEIGG